MMCYGHQGSSSFVKIHKGKFEDDPVYTYDLQPFTYVGYLDDIFLIW